MNITEYYGEPPIDPMPGGGWILTDNWLVKINGNPFVIPKGFKTNLASSPRIFKPILDNDDPVALKPSIVHDFLYQLAGKTLLYTCTRAHADSIFRDGMIALGCSTTVAYTSYYSLRLFGSSNWGTEFKL